MVVRPPGPEAAMKRRRAPPTSEEVIAKIKDDGDFDTLRLKIVRKVKDNEDLRNSIVTQVKQSMVLNTDGSEDLKPGQLSDAIYEELGSKIMGQISDEVWKVIRSNDNIKNDIRGTVESVYTRLVNPEEEKDQAQSSAPKVQSNGGKEEDNVPSVAVSLSEANVHPDENDLDEPPGFVRCTQKTSCKIEVELEDPVHDEQTSLPSNGVLDRPLDVTQAKDDLPPGFGDGEHSNVDLDDASDEDPDVPPGFE